MWVPGRRVGSIGTPRSTQHAPGDKSNIRYPLRVQLGDIL